MSGVKYLKHRKKIETRIENLEKHIKYIEIQELLESFGWWSTGTIYAMWNKTPEENEIIWLLSP